MVAAEKTKITTILSHSIAVKFLLKEMPKTNTARKTKAKINMVSMYSKKVILITISTKDKIKDTTLGIFDKPYFIFFIIIV